MLSKSLFNPTLPLKNIGNMGKKPQSILVVEDQSLFLDLTVQMLYEFNCHQAKTLDEAIEMFDLYHSEIVFLDLALPDGSGLDVLRHVRSVSKESFVVILTESTVEKDIRTAMELGASHYVLKPISRRKIKECLDKYGYTEEDV